MKRTFRLPALAGIVAAAAVAFLAPLPQSRALGQESLGLVGYGPTVRYYSGYGPVDYGQGLGYAGVYRRGANGYSGYGYGPYGYGSDGAAMYRRGPNGYTGYGNGPYGYGSQGAQVYRFNGGYSYGSRSYQYYPSSRYYGAPYGGVYSPYFYGTY